MRHCQKNTTPKNGHWQTNTHAYEAKARRQISNMHEFQKTYEIFFDSYLPYAKTH